MVDDEQPDVAVVEEPDVARKTIVDEQSDDEPISKDVESLLAAAKGVDPDTKKDAQVLAKMYKFCHYAKENSSTSFTPQIKQLIWPTTALRRA